LTGKKTDPIIIYMVEPSALQKYSLFGGITEDQINKILPRLGEESYDPDADIIVEGHRNDKIRFILEGKVAVIKGGVILSEFGEGDAFGEMEVLDIMPSAATIRARTPVRLMAISNKTLHEIYKTDPDVFSMLIMNLARDLSRRLRKMNEIVVHESPPMEWN
jgi:CRP-like cAMP-binding protein